MSQVTKTEVSRATIKAKKGIRATVLSRPFDGKLVKLKVNPWTSGRLAKALQGIGKSAKKQYVLANLPPWFGGKYDAMSSRQIDHLKRFSSLATETAGLPIEERIAKMAYGLRKTPAEKAPVTRYVIAKGERFHEIIDKILKK